MKKRNIGVCAKLHDKIVDMSTYMLFKDIASELNIPRSTLKDYCKRNSIIVNHGRNKMEEYTSEIIKLAEAGMHNLDIATKLDIDPSSLKYHAAKLGINIRNGNLREENGAEEIAVIDLYNKNFTYLEIADKLNIPSKRIPDYLDKHGIPRIGCVEKRVIRNETNLRAFSDMTKEEDVYWLGWIITDGCLGDSNTVSLSLKGSDVKLIEEFRDYISPGSSVSVRNYFHNQLQKTVSTASVSIKNKTIADNLRLQNVESRKSCKERLPNFDYINSPVAPIFWRACVEGDGYVRKDLRSSEVQLVGSNELLSGFIAFCELHCKVVSRRVPNNRNYGNPEFKMVRYTGADARKIMRVLWDSGSIFLERKKKIVESQLNHWGDR